MQELLYEIGRQTNMVSTCPQLARLTEYIPPFWVSEIIHVAMLVSVLGGVAGFVVMLYPAMVWDVSRLFFRWGDKMEAPLNRTIRVERWFYRNNKFTGSGIALLSFYALSYYSFIYNRVFVYHYFAFFYDPMLVDWFLASMEFLFLVFFLIALVFGLVVYFRPSLIKRIETIGNTWVIPAEELHREIPDPLYPSRWLGLRVMVVHLSLLVIYTLLIFSIC